MLWNWYTVDACFISRTWQIRSHGAFAGSCIGVIFLVMSLEFLRRAQREFDQYLARRKSSTLLPRNGSESTEGSGHGDSKLHNASVTVRATRSSGGGDYTARLKVWEQALRSLLFMMQFGVGYFVMLLAMYYNGRSRHCLLLVSPCTYLKIKYLVSIPFIFLAQYPRNSPLISLALHCSSPLLPVAFFRISSAFLLNHPRLPILPLPPFKTILQRH